jgi:hypothetical protein
MLSQKNSLEKDNENITNTRRAKGGECQKNEEYMKIYCHKSCLLCSDMYRQLTADAKQSITHSGLNDLIVLISDRSNNFCEIRVRRRRSLLSRLGDRG